MVERSFFPRDVNGSLEGNDISWPNELLRRKFPYILTLNKYFDLKHCQERDIHFCSIIKFKKKSCPFRIIIVFFKWTNCSIVCIILFTEENIHFWNRVIVCYFWNYNHLDRIVPIYFKNAQIFYLGIFIAGVAPGIGCMQKAWF